MTRTSGIPDFQNPGASPALRFPDEFLFGSATAATQVEGSCPDTDWAAFARERGRIKNGDGPEPACDTWRRFEEDAALQRSLGLGAHRFSIEWARVEPRPGERDAAALERYRRMLGALRDAGIEPMVTLLHFSLPQWLAERGGLESPDFVAAFGQFVRWVAEALGDLCHLWVTINEPTASVVLGYLEGLFPPAKRDLRAALRALYQQVAAHVTAYRVLHEVCGRSGRTPEVGAAHHLRVFHPMRASHPLDRAGAWVSDRVFNRSFAEALCTGRMFGVLDRVMPLPGGLRVTDARGTQDFFGLNYYTRDLIRFSLRHAQTLLMDRRVPDGSELSDIGWEIHPEGLGELLATWQQRSGRPMYVTENGIADALDSRRARFLLDHLGQVARAIASGVDVRGYFHWSLLDNFEWAEGYAPRFGLCETDYATQARRPRPSALLYADIARTRSVPRSGTPLRHDT